MRSKRPNTDSYGPAYMWIALLDLDMNGHEDIVAGHTGAQDPVFYLNDGDGAFRPLANLFSIENPYLFSFLDLDQNGFLDVLWSYPGCYDGTCPKIHFIVRALGCPVFLPSVCRNHSVGD